jgi:hypothetical protein
MNHLRTLLRRATAAASLLSVFSVLPSAYASSIISNFTLTNTIFTDGSVTTPSGVTPGDLTSFDLTGGNSGSGLPGTTTFSGTAPGTGIVEFLWSYTSCYPPNQQSMACDSPGADWTGYLVNQTMTQLTDTDTQGVTAMAEFSVTAGSTFGWYVGTIDNQGEPGTITVSDISFSATSGVPEPGTWSLFLIAIAAVAALKVKSRKLRMRVIFVGALLCAGTALFAQQVTYAGGVVTGQLKLTTTTNLSQFGSPSSVTPTLVADGVERPIPRPLPRPPVIERSVRLMKFHEPIRAGEHLQTLSLSPDLVTSNAAFNGLTHSDQRNANSGNQFSIEPPSPGVAVANGKVLEGVNNAVRVFSTSGAPLTATVSSNQLFGLAPAIDRTKNPNVYGPYPTDMRVFYDQDISRWFVLQRSLDNDALGNNLSSSHLYLAVSQTSDPTGVYNIYVMDTSDVTNDGCPCLDDYLQVGADRYGFYISADEYGIQDPNYPFFDDAVILAISKADLAAGVVTPKASRFNIPPSTGFEFAIQPATTPPGAFPDLASGGVEFFVSSEPGGSDNTFTFGQNGGTGQVALWAMSNTASLQSFPTPLLTQTTVNSPGYLQPQPGASQRSGPLTLGTTLEQLDAGFDSDSRVQSVVYSGGRLYVTLASEIFDANANPQVGVVYFVFSPTFRSGVLGGTAPVKQGYLSVTNENILRPAMAVNPQGRGVIAFTLSGPDYYPSAAYVAIDLTAATPSAMQIVGPGQLPEDGFTGYPAYGGSGIARWGDYSTAFTSPDGTIWFTTEYIPNLPRTPLANWGTFIAQFQP